MEIKMENWKQDADGWADGNGNHAWQGEDGKWWAWKQGWSNTSGAWDTWQEAAKATQD